MKITMRTTLRAFGTVVLLAAVGLLTTVTPARAQPAPAAGPRATAQLTPTVFDLNGTYTDGGSARPVISNVNDILTIDMSSQHRPAASGIVLSSDTILSTFPDDATYGAKLVAPGTIMWSNGSAWQKLPPPSLVVVPDVVGLDRHTAISTLSAAGFVVAEVSKRYCDADGVVYDQRPRGSLALEGSTVHIYDSQLPIDHTICPAP